MHIMRICVSEKPILVTVMLFNIKIEGKAHAGNATQKIHTPLMQRADIHI